MSPETLEFDLRGQICPSTLLTALREINNHQQELKDSRLTLTFYTDNRHATITVPQTAANMGLHCEIDRLDDAYVIRIEGGNA